MLSLRLERGEVLPFMVDTGSPVTLLDKSLEGKLGKRFGTMPVWNVSGSKQTSGIFPAIKLFLGNTQLKTGTHIHSYDFQQHPMGILGMDCLRHYCVQMDFEAGRMRFLNSGQMDAAGLGKAFPLTFKNGYPFIERGGLVGESTNLLIDVGCSIDGLMSKGTNKFEAVYLPESDWDGETYANLFVVAPGNVNALGLRFLARHLVTLDFPNQTLYLKRTSASALDFAETTVPGESARKSGLKFLMHKADKGQLPGWPTVGKEPIYFEAHSIADSKSATFKVWGKNGAYSSHYVIVRTDKETPWRLQKAWKTDHEGKTTEEHLFP